MNILLDESSPQFQLLLEAVETHTGRAEPMAAIRAQVALTLSGELVDMTLLGWVRSKIIEVYPLGGEASARGLRLTRQGAAMLRRPRFEPPSAVAA